MESKKRTRNKTPGESAKQGSPGAARTDNRHSSRPGARERGPADQLGSILSRGLDLAEASLGLGLTVISRMGTLAQQQVLDRISPASPAPDLGQAAPTEAAPGAAVGQPGQTVQAQSVPQEPSYCITNRLPLAPGGIVEVSFSINNDSMTTPKQVRLTVDGFTGEAEGGRFEAGPFVVKPSRRTIAPMDFEKFVLHGAVPPEVQPDVYHGWVVVTSGSEFRIPIRLVVLAL